MNDPEKIHQLVGWLEQYRGDNAGVDVIDASPAVDKHLSRVLIQHQHVVMLVDGRMMVYDNEGNWTIWAQVQATGVVR